MVKMLSLECSLLREEKHSAKNLLLEGLAYLYSAMSSKNVGVYFYDFKNMIYLTKPTGGINQAHIPTIHVIPF